MKELNMQLPYDIGDEVWVQEHGKFVETYNGHMDYTRVPMKGMVSEINVTVNHIIGPYVHYIKVAKENGWEEQFNTGEIYLTREACQRASYLYNCVCIEGTIKYDSNGKAYKVRRDN